MDVTVIGPHYSAALIARDLGDDWPDVDRRYEFVVTHDRDLVLDCSVTDVTHHEPLTARATRERAVRWRRASAD